MHLAPDVLPQRSRRTAWTVIPLYGSLAASVQVISYRLHKLADKRTYFFRVEVLERSGNMLRKREAVEPFRNSGLHHVLKRVLCVSAELA